VESGPGDTSALLTALTTEHFTLQASRSATVTESLGRSTIYLGSLSASLVALALVARGDTTPSDFRLFALEILPPLVFLGTVTFVRAVETGIEDAICGQAINRIRRFYLELAGEDARYFALGGTTTWRARSRTWGSRVSLAAARQRRGRHCRGGGCRSASLARLTSLLERGPPLSAALPVSWLTASDG
jgi:hypothetical protein